MFIRTKQIKGKEYAYLSENKWNKKTKKVKQSTKKYLGKVYRFEKVADIEFDCKADAPEDLIRAVVEWELRKHGFKQNNMIWQKEECFVDLKNKKVYGKRGVVAIGMNQGLLADYTLRRLFHYTRIKNGYDYAKKFVEAGLDVPKEVFVEIYGKIFK